MQIPLALRSDCGTNGNPLLLHGFPNGRNRDKTASHPSVKRMKRATGFVVGDFFSGPYMYVKKARPLLLNSKHKFYHIKE